MWFVPMVCLFTLINRARIIVFLHSGLFACMKWIYIYLIIYLFIFRYFSFGQSENAQAQAHVIIVIKAKPYHLTHETQTHDNSK